MDVGIKKVIRIGGQSHSSILQGHNIRDISKTEPKTKSERQLLGKSYTALEDSEQYINGTLDNLHVQSRGTQWRYLEDHLRFRHPRIYNQFSNVDEEGFESAGRHPFDTWIPRKRANASGRVGTQEQLQLILRLAYANVFSLNINQKMVLVNHWIGEIQEEEFDRTYESIKQAQNDQDSIHDIHQEVDRRVLQKTDVIGITTTGLAKNVALLKRLDCKVIICEEAGEVLEAHILSTLLPSVEHVIQIGDHEQLRPSVSNFSLSMESHQGVQYKLDRSQFERLAVGEPGRSKIPVAQLNVQRRMRPEVSKLIRNTIYPDLKDHSTTLNRPDVAGMRQNVFWLDHCNLEDGQQSEHQQTGSKSNKWEVQMVHALVRHIIRQGIYSSSEIAVLTPYTGQLQKLRAAMRNDFEVVLSDRDQDALEKDGLEGCEEETKEKQPSVATNRRVTLAKKQLSEMLRIATVDNFQGEEAKIIIVSLVRSNNARKVGFLKTTNRINVLLSRAKLGMYLIGNSETYSNVPMWRDVIQMLQATNSLSTSLGLRCPRHPDTLIEVTEPGDFAQMSPEGGCRLPCDRRLPECGHQCLARCHSDSMHGAYTCIQPCERLHHPCNHPCQKATCGEGTCIILLKPRNPNSSSICRLLIIVLIYRVFYYMDPVAATARTLFCIPEVSL